MALSLFSMNYRFLSFLLTIWILTLVCPPEFIFAQHVHADTMHMGPQGKAHRMAGILGVENVMNMEGSGTSWHPEVTPMEGKHWQGKRMSTALHGRAFMRYTNQDLFQAGARGAQAFGFPGWAMGMAILPTGKRTQVAFRLMVTGEPLTEGGDGYPLLFQTGETFKGIPNVDWQHPHDLFAEISATVSYTSPNGRVLFLYVGLPGEPAIGPPAFMHRPSASMLADAPLGHHWQDATHVTFGVVTAGIVEGPFKLDFSVFTGREPDEDRYDIDQPLMDSYSGRFAWNPTKNWAFQVSSGYIRSPEAHSPSTDVWRSSASLLYGNRLEKRNTSLSLVWGLNNPISSTQNQPQEVLFHTHTQDQHAFLLEFLQKREAFTGFGRIEYVQKEAEELRLGDPPNGKPLWIGSLTAGVSREIALNAWCIFNAGMQLSTFNVPRHLQASYGKIPFSGQVFVRVAIP